MCHFTMGFEAPRLQIYMHGLCSGKEAVAGTPVGCQTPSCEPPMQHADFSKMQPMDDQGREDL